jgi:hypothetical protein
MLQFIPLTEFKFRREGRLLAMAAPYTCCYVWQGVARYRTLREGWRWNGASVPRPLHWWQSPFAPWVAGPSALHDDAYLRQDITRREADALFLASLVYYARAMYPVTASRGWPRRWQRCRLARKLRQARVMYRAVRTFGGVWWRRAKST